LRQRQRIEQHGRCVKLRIDLHRTRVALCKVFSQKSAGPHDESLAVSLSNENNSRSEQVTKTATSA